jgi:hypothetical protein
MMFDIKKSNVISDEENYYFFRALNNGDNLDAENRDNYRCRWELHKDKNR